MDVKELYAKDPESTRKEAAGLESVTLTSEDLEWVHVLAEGWASPLEGPFLSLLRDFTDIIQSFVRSFSFVIVFRFLFCGCAWEGSVCASSSSSLFKVLHDTVFYKLDSRGYA